ncbi:MAG: flagellar type III secretion system protein FliQ [Phycisphaeraceae bacterium]|nr:flagellar type III secretion system protein FliQ [Phycisphaeraceae bacterium]
MTSVTVDLLRDALLLALLIAAPLLAAALIVGLLTSLAQAVTQVQDQTLAFLPKIVAVVVTAVVLLGWLGSKLVDFAVRMFAGGV